MTWLELLQQVNDPARTRNELIDMNNTLKLDNKGSLDALRNRLRLHIASQADPTQEVPGTTRPSARPPVPEDFIVRPRTFAELSGLGLGGLGDEDDEDEDNAPPPRRSQRGNQSRRPDNVRLSPDEQAAVERLRQRGLSMRDVDRLLAGLPSAEDEEEDQVPQARQRSQQGPQGPTLRGSAKRDGVLLEWDYVPGSTTTLMRMAPEHSTFYFLNEAQAYEDTYLDRDVQPDHYRYKMYQTDNLYNRGPYSNVVEVEFGAQPQSPGPGQQPPRAPQGPQRPPPPPSAPPRQPEAPAQPVPPQPPNIRAQAYDGSNEISWGQVDGATAYLVYRRTRQTNFSQHGNTTDTLYVDTHNMRPGETYWYYVKSVGPGGESTNSNTASATQPKSAEPEHPSKPWWKSITDFGKFDEGKKG